MTISCVYSIRNAITGTTYIGSTNDAHRRHNEHFRKLKLGKHDNRFLQASYNKHGADNFLFEIIEFVDDHSLLIPREQSIYNNWQGKTYNIGKFVDVPLRGVKGELHPRFGMKLSPEHRAKCANSGERNGMFGRNHSEESKRKMSENSKGRIISPEARANMSAAGKGRKKSDEHKKKIKESNIGKVKPRGSANHSFKGTIQQISKDGIVLKEFNGTTEILNAGFSPSGVYSCLTGKQYTHRGFIWKRKT